MLNADFRDRGAYVRDADALVVADLHVGRAAASDVAYPLGEAADLSERLRSLLDRFEPVEVVFAGDATHRFDRVSVDDERALSELVDACRDAGARAVFVRGNHDTALSEAWDGPVHDAYELDASVCGGPVVVRHGHEAPPATESAGLYVVGHDHPTIDIEGRRRPCWLYAEGGFRDADVLMLPAFTRLAAGVEVNDRSAWEFQSPFVTDADALRPIVAAGAADASGESSDAETASDDPLVFPPLGEFRRLL
ncbi:metallophosphoesterase [Halobaculum halobium]|uniref:Metallophosphoesterase n=1 Tax=Halobaculum halobium TaxID=3032281 RepID=A0ABD5THH9_9EURY|nr:metallophosphoesterase [Halobaculum sp. SYNS20]